MVIVFNATLYTISAILWWWRAVLLVEKPEYVEKTLTYIKSLANFITYSYIEYTSP
jgi:hypothetical protein